MLSCNFGEVFIELRFTLVDLRFTLIELRFTLIKLRLTLIKLRLTLINLDAGICLPHMSRSIKRDVGF